MSSISQNASMDQEPSKASDEYVIQKIVDKKVVKNKVMYLCKWKYWENSDNTWEPITNLQTCIELVHEFEASIKAKTKNNKKTEEPINQIKKPQQKKKTQSKALSNQQKQVQTKKPSKLKRPNQKAKQMSLQNERRTSEIKDKTVPKNRAQNIKIQTPPKKASFITGNNNNFYNVQDDDIIDRVNYHQYVNDKLYYSVDSHTRDGKILPCYLKTSQQLKKSAPLLLIKYIEDFVIEVEEYNNDRRMAQKSVDTMTQQ